MRLRISEKVVGLKSDKFGGGIIGKRKGSGESDGENLERMRSILSLKKIGGMNWQVIVCRVCQGMYWMGCGGELNLKFSKVCEGWRMIQ